MGMRLSGQTALITGSGSGIGRAIALRFAAEGAKVVVNDFLEQGADTVAQIEAAGGEALFVQADLRAEQQVQEMAAQIEQRFGRLDTLVNNAGVRGSSNVLTAEDAEWDKIIDTNLKGAWYCCKHAIPLMIRSGGGSVINISSTHVMRTQADHFPYHVAKGGLHTMTLGLAVDFGPQGIRANNLCPGFIMTKMADQFLDTFADRAKKEAGMLSAQPLNRFGTPEDVAGAAVFLASDEARFISGTSLVIDGGRSALQKSD